MNSSQFTETFEIGPDFLRIYTFFLNKYLHGRASSSAIELLTDLHERLGCFATALISFDGTNNRATVCCPGREKETITTLINCSDARQEIHQTARDDNITGHSFLLKPHNYEIDIIPLPWQPGSKTVRSCTILFCLVDPSFLQPIANHLADRVCQRGMIAQFLCTWWIRFCIPRISILDESSVLAVTDTEAGQVISSWLYSIPIPELVRRAIKGAKRLRSKLIKEYYFPDETSYNRFLWKKWFPAIPPEGFDIESAKDLQEQTRCLVYWSRWVDSHHDLERERAIPTSLSMNEQSQCMSIVSWIKEQRLKSSIISKQLEQLRGMAANTFLTGCDGLAPRPSKRDNQEILPITRKSLLCFSLNSWLKPEGQLCRDLADDVLSNIEFCRALHGVAVTSHYLFGEQPLSDDVIHRFMQLVARYGHGDLGIPSRVDLRAHLLQAARGEPALHTLKSFYRDHFFHALEVCFLGQVLLDTKLDEHRSLWQLVAERLCLKTGKATQQKVLRLWYLAALLHDIGYAIDVLKSSRKFFGFFRHSEALCCLVDSLDRWLTGLSEEEEVRELGILQGSNVGQDHGIIGALHLRSLLQRIARDDRSVSVEDYMPAIQAIAQHNLRQHHDKVSFAEQPLAFLLAICDQLQEWRRPRLAFATSPNWLLAKLSGDSTDSIKLEGAFKSLTTNLEVLSDNTNDINLRFRSSAKGRPTLAFTMEYDEQINRNSSVFRIWLDATLNFQRLDFDGLPLDITVIYTTPCYKDHNHNMKLPQLYRLRDAAHETHMSFLLDWFPTKQDESKNDGSLTNGAVTYRYDEREGSEELTLDLRELSHKVLMTRGMDAFWERLKEWKHFNDDRDFPGDYVQITPE